MWAFDWQGGEIASRLGGARAYTHEEFARRIDAGARLVCYIVRDDLEAAQIDEEFDWFCDFTFELAGQLPGRKLIVVDESQDLIDPWNIPPGFERILCRGGRRMIDTVVCGSSANALEGTARNQVSELYCFRCVDDNAVKYPKSVGIDPEKVKALPDTHFIFKDMRTGRQNNLDLWGLKSNEGNS